MLPNRIVAFAAWIALVLCPASSRAQSITPAEIAKSSRSGPDLTLPLESKSVRFAVIGDSGTGDAPQYEVAAEMEAYGLPGSIQVTAATHQRLCDKYLFEERGAFYVRNRGEVETYLLRGRRSGKLRNDELGK